MATSIRNATSHKIIYSANVAILILLSVLYFRFVGLFFPVDDAYIVTHNVQVLRLGQDPNFDNASPLSGTTSAIHLALIAVLSFLMSPLMAQYVATWLAIGIYATGLLKLAFLHGLSNWKSVSFLILGLIVAEAPHQLLNGLETGLAMALLVWLLILVLEKADTWMVPIFCGSLSFVRPELFAFSGMIYLWQVWRLWKSRSRTIFLKSLFKFTGLLFLGAAPWFLWYLTSTGWPYPSTIEAKKFFFAENTLPLATRLTFVFLFFFQFLIKTGPLAASFGLLPRSYVEKLSLLFLAIFLAAYLQFPGGLHHYEYRYLYLFVPLMLYAVIHHLTLESYKKFGNIILIATLLYSLILFPKRFASHLDWCKFTKSESAMLSQWCIERVPENAKLLIHDIGYISHATHFKMVDLVGLKTESSIAFHKSYTVPSSGRLRGLAIQKIAELSQPTHLIVLNEWDRVFRITDALKENGWRLEPLRIAPNDNRKFYEVYRIIQFRNEQLIGKD